MTRPGWLSDARAAALFKTINAIRADDPVVFVPEQWVVEADRESYDDATIFGARVHLYPGDRLYVAIEIAGCDRPGTSADELTGRTQP